MTLPSVDVHTFESSALVYDHQAHFPDWINELRQQCHDRYLSASGFNSKDEQWQFFDCDRVLKQPLNAHFSEHVSEPLMTDRPSILMTDRGVLEFQLVQGVEMLALDQLSESDYTRLLHHWTGILGDKNLFNVLHFSQLKSIAILKITDKVSLDDVQHIVVRMTNALAGVEHVKLVLMVDSHATGSFVIEGIGDQLASIVSHVSVDVFCDEGSTLKVVWSHSASEAVSRFTTVKGRVSDEATFKLTYLNRNLPILRHEIAVEIEGESANVELRGLSLLTGDQEMHQAACIHHHKENGVSYQLFKHILIDQAKSGFTGLVYVEPEAQKTDAYQTNNNLLLSDKARSISRPQLEIFADDVKCSHGSITGQIDEEVLFYLMSRGLSRPKALSVLLEGFVDEVLDLIDIPDIADLYRNDMVKVLARIGEEVEAQS